MEPTHLSQSEGLLIVALLLLVSMPDFIGFWRSELRRKKMKKAIHLVVIGTLLSSSIHAFAPDYEQKLMTPLKKEDANEIIKQLGILQASIDGLCIKSRGFTANIVSADFYEYHSFLNLTIKYLQDATYEVAERIRSIDPDGWANISVADIQKKSKVSDAKLLVTKPSEMIVQLIDDYRIVSNLSRGIFRMAASVGDAGTIALMTKTTNQLEHFLWELRTMNADKG